jgi:hypothetical protein
MTFIVIGVASCGASFHGRWLHVGIASSEVEATGNSVM